MVQKSAAKPIPGATVKPAPVRPSSPIDPKPTGLVLKVRALQVGYYGEKRRRVDDIFVLEDAKHFSATWMAYVDPNTPERITTGQQALRQQHDEMIAAKIQPGMQTGRDDVHDVPTGTLNPLGDDD
jgi:hypothetical protein